MRFTLHGMVYVLWFFMETYKIKLESFEGPLDLLLQLIENRKLHINDISLAKITDDYLAYLEKLETFPLKEAAHFVLIASTLVLIKSKSLLPEIVLTEEEEGDIKNLEERLREYQRIQELSRHIADLYGARPIFIREEREIFPVFSPSKKMTLEDFRQWIGDVLKSFPKKEMIPQVFIKKVISLEETIEALLERIKTGMEVTLSGFSGERGRENRVHVIISFLAILELLKQGIISVKQDSHFSDIIVGKNT